MTQAARRGHIAIVETLRQAGANLGGSDLEGGFAAIEVERAGRRGDTDALRVWNLAGFTVDENKTYGGSLYRKE